MSENNPYHPLAELDVYEAKIALREVYASLVEAHKKTRANLYKYRERLIKGDLPRHLETKYEVKADFAEEWLDTLDQLCTMIEHKLPAHWKALEDERYNLKEE